MASKTRAETEQERIHEVREAALEASVRHATQDMGTVEKAVWLVNEKGFRVHDVAIAFDLSPNVLRSAIGAVHEGRTIGHVGRPRILHEGSEEELCTRILAAHNAGTTLTKAECLEIANEIYQAQYESDKAAGRINPEKAIEWGNSPPHLSSSFIGSFLSRHSGLPTRSAHEPVHGKVEEPSEIPQT